jgi:hypothetical protein
MEAKVVTSKPRLFPASRYIEWSNGEIDLEEYSSALWREAYNELVNQFLVEEETASKPILNITEIPVPNGTL